MEKLFDKFMDELDEFIKATGLNEYEICNDAFYNHASCECVYGGSEPYFDTANEQWYPGEPADYLVTGYKAYLSDIVQAVVEAFAEHYCVYKSAELVDMVYENISDIFQDALLDEDAFEAKAIDNYHI